MIHKPIDEITAADIQALIDDEVMESRTIEYKRDLPGGSDKDKFEFLADVTAFANAGGGDLIFGITEENGKPVAATGLDMADLDREILRLEDLLRNGVDPRIPVVQTKVVTDCEKNQVLVIHIPNSWSSPHMITLKGSQKFYLRNNGRKDKMDVTEIRAAFALSDSIAEKIRRFRDDRLAKLIAGDGPVRLEGKYRMIAHVLPLISFSPDFQLSADELKKQSSKLSPMGWDGWTTRYNLDGVINVAAQDDPTGPCIAYCQIFRTGVIEAATSYFIYDPEGQPSIHGISYEDDIIKTIKGNLDALRSLEVPPPFFLMVHMVGVEGCGIYIVRRLVGRHKPKIDRDILILPEVLIEDYCEDVERRLRPIFDAVWNAAGLKGSLNYDEQGNWRSHGDI